jgi:hypothetical protein
MAKLHKMGTSARVPSVAALVGIVLIWSIASAAVTAIRRASGFAVKPSAKLLVKSRRATRRELWQDQTNHSKIPQVTFGSFGRRCAAFALGKHRHFPRWLGDFVSSAPEIKRPQGEIAS